MLIFCAVVIFAGAVLVVHAETDRIVEQLRAILLVVSANEAGSAMTPGDLQTQRHHTTRSGTLTRE